MSIKTCKTQTFLQNRRLYIIRKDKTCGNIGMKAKVNDIHGMYGT